MLNIYMLTYNRANYIKESIESILNQTYKDFRLIILNNCSTDNTLDVINSIHDDRITVITHEQNIGAINNGNWPFMNNDEKYFMIIHDDDVYEPEMVETELKFMESNPQVALVSVIGSIIDSDGNYKAKREKRSLEECNKYLYTKGEYFLNKITKQGKEIYCPTVMWRKEWVDNHKILSRAEAGPACDFVQYSEVCFAGGTIAVLDTALFNYREHAGQDSFQNLYNKFDLREIDTLYKLNEEYKVNIDKSEFSKYLSYKMAFRAYQIAKHKLGKEQIIKARKEVEQKEFFLGYTKVDKLIINLSTMCPWVIRMAARLRDMRGR